MNFRTLQLSRWQQFQDVEIRFHDRLTILTGANGSGKTTLLNLLATHAGWQNTPLATPKREAKTGAIRFLLRLFAGEDKSDEKSIGKLIYSNGVEASLVIAGGDSAQYSIQIQDQQQVDCFYIPSHRSVFRYEPLQNLPTIKKNKNSAFSEVFNSNKSRYFGSGGQSSSFFMKGTLIGWVIAGYGVRSESKSIMPPDTEQLRLFEGFQEILRKLLPVSLGFKEIEIRNYEVVFICNEGRDEFVLETASGGVSALIDMAWQIYMFATSERPDFTVLIDEVENHLHPSMQRHVLEDLINAFPQTRFVVATHSPLIVSSVKDSNVYALIYNKQMKVVSTRLDLKDKAKTAAEILDEVLGVSSTMPVWVEAKLQAILAKYSSGVIVPEDLARLRQDLAEVGLEKLMPTAINAVLDGQK